MKKLGTPQNFNFVFQDFLADSKTWYLKLHILPGLHILTGPHILPGLHILPGPHILPGLPILVGLKVK